MSTKRVVPFSRSRTSGGLRLIETLITQEYLEMFLTAARELEAAQEAFREIYSNLRYSILAGAKVEPGTHEAHIIETGSTGRLIPQFRYKKLVVR